ncbi:MAG TPA: hypothetical protein ENG50_01570 [Candidatus Altiarchaeales archaeon]|nr:hypothetical protein [Candidatus Altiarchaeales archaeon]
MSLFFYFTGIVSGILIFKYLTEESEKKIKERQVEYSYISMIWNSLDCNALERLKVETVRDVRNIGKEIVNLEREGKVNDDRYKNLVNEYTTLSIKAWILSKTLKQRCGKNLKTILYFYSVPCKKCELQGYEIEKFMEEYNDSIDVFVINVNVTDPLVKMLKSIYKIEKTPTIVIENKSYDFITYENLSKLFEK